MILGGLAAETSFTEAEILAMDLAGARFWWNAVAAFRQQQADAET